MARLVKYTFYLKQINLSKKIHKTNIYNNNIFIEYFSFKHQNIILT